MPNCSKPFNDHLAWGQYKNEQENYIFKTASYTGCKTIANNLFIHNLNYGFVAMAFNCFVHAYLLKQL